MEETLLEKFEYYFEYYFLAAPKIQEKLNDLGEQGWAVQSVKNEGTYDQYDETGNRFHFDEKGDRIYIWNVFAKRKKMSI